LRNQLSRIPLRRGREKKKFDIAVQEVMRYRLEHGEPGSGKSPVGEKSAGRAVEGTISSMNRDISVEGKGPEGQ